MTQQLSFRGPEFSPQNEDQAAHNGEKPQHPGAQCPLLGPEHTVNTLTARCAHKIKMVLKIQNCFEKKTKNILGTGESSQWIRAHTASTEDLSSVPSTQPTTACSYSSVGLQCPPSLGFMSTALMCIGPHRHFTNRGNREPYAVAHTSVPALRTQRQRERRLSEST